MSEMADEHCANGAYDFAVHIYFKSLQARQNKLGPEHDEEVTNMTKLAFVCTKLNKFNQAEELYLQIHDIYAKK